MMSIPKALALAAEAKIPVGKVKKTTLAGRSCSIFRGNKQAIRHEVQVGQAVCFYETHKGGAASWQVEFNGATVAGGYQGEAIARAVRLQTA